MEVTLHIGTEKTGTTTIQHFLALNRNCLLSNGILIPQSLGEPNHWLLHSMVNHLEVLDVASRHYGLLDVSERAMAKEKWRNAFIREVERAGLPRCLISSEHLQSRLRQPEDLDRLRELLLGLFSKIRIVLYLRRPIDTAVSLLSTEIKYGATEGDVPPPANECYRHIVNHAETIQLWQNAFPDAQFVIRLFSGEAFVKGSLIDDFIDACALPTEVYDYPPSENESLSLLGLEILRRVNKHCPFIMANGTMNPHREGIIPYFERHFSVGARLIPSSSIVEMYEREFAASNEWVRSRFFPNRSHLFPNMEYLQESPKPLDNDQLDGFANAIVELWNLRTVSTS